MGNLVLKDMTTLLTNFSIKKIKLKYHNKDIPIATFLCFFLNHQAACLINTVTFQEATSTYSTLNFPTFLRGNTKNLF